ncbi:MAG: hypothetical protein U0930_00885 [Pirellulales bacterium]
MAISDLLRTPDDMPSLQAAQLVFPKRSELENILYNGHAAQPPLRIAPSNCFSCHNLASRVVIAKPHYLTNVDAGQ